MRQWQSGDGDWQARGCALAPIATQPAVPPLLLLPGCPPWHCPTLPPCTPPHTAQCRRRTKLGRLVGRISPLGRGCRLPAGCIVPRRGEDGNRVSMSLSRCTHLSCASVSPISQLFQHPASTMRWESLCTSTCTHRGVHTLCASTCTHACLHTAEAPA